MTPRRSSLGPVSVGRRFIELRLQLSFGKEQEVDPLRQGGAMEERSWGILASFRPAQVLSAGLVLKPVCSVSLSAAWLSHGNHGYP